jgi:glycerophosphoryl diester phosphodiesterase
MIEIDLHTTRDGAVVVAHDAELERLGGRGEIGGATAEEIRRLDAGEGERIPTLDETLDAFGRRIAFNLELKQSTRGAYAGLEAVALEAVRRRGVLDRTLFSCFWDEVLHGLRRLASEARLGVLVSPRAPQRVLERARTVDTESIHPHFALVTAELVTSAHGEGLAVHPYTVDDTDQMRRLLDLGVDGLFTNVPDRLRALVDGG